MGWLSPSLSPHQAICECTVPSGVLIRTLTLSSIPTSNPPSLKAPEVLLCMPSPPFLTPRVLLCMLTLNDPSPFPLHPDRNPLKGTAMHANLEGHRLAGVRVPGINNVG